MDSAIESRLLSFCSSILMHNLPLLLTELWGHSYEIHIMGKDKVEEGEGVS
jgi:hypothetical protein